jgi:hypothetical protein
VLQSLYFVKKYHTGNITRTAVTTQDALLLLLHYEFGLLSYFHSLQQICRLWSSRLWRRLTSYRVTNVSRQRIVSIFRAEPCKSTRRLHRRQNPKCPIDLSVPTEGYPSPFSLPVCTLTGHICSTYLSPSIPPEQGWATGVPRHTGVSSQGFRCAKNLYKKFYIRMLQSEKGNLL